MNLLDKAALACFHIEPSARQVETANALLAQITDHKAFSDSVVRLGIAPLLYHNRQKYQLTPTLLQTVTAAYHQTLARSMRLAAAFQELATACTAQYIAILPLKGIYVSDVLYQNLGLRLMSDIDILVKPEEAQACMAVLRNLGYLCHQNFEAVENTEVIHYDPFVRAGVMVEIHIKFHRRIEKYDLAPTLVWQHSVEATVHGCPVQIMDAYDTLIFCCLHLDRHFNNKGVQFTGYADIVNLLATTPASFSFAELEKRCQLYQCSTQVFKHILMAQKHLHANVPSTVVERYAHTLRTPDEQRFIHFLQGNNAFDTGMPRHLSNIIYVKGFSNKVKYIVNSIFPPVSFIRTKYKLQPNQSVGWYYLHRWFNGLIGLLKMRR